MRKTVCFVGLVLSWLIVGGITAGPESELPISQESGEAPAPLDEAQCRTDNTSILEAEAVTSTESRGIDTCPLYHRCICHCQQERICCNNSGGQNCYEEEANCFDTCVAILSPGQQCGTTTCWLDPFCDFP